MKRFTKGEFKLIERHYLKFKLFGKEFFIWNTSPKQVLEHVTEVNHVKDFHTWRLPNDKPQPQENGLREAAEIVEKLIEASEWMVSVKPMSPREKEKLYHEQSIVIAKAKEWLNSKNH